MLNREKLHATRFRFETRAFDKGNELILRHFAELTRRDGRVVMPAHWAWTQVGRSTEAERKLLRTMFASEREAIEAMEAMELQALAGASA